jgi:hypothetical protein
VNLSSMTDDEKGELAAAVEAERAGRRNLTLAEERREELGRTRLDIERRLATRRLVSAGQGSDTGGAGTDERIELSLPG